MSYTAELLKSQIAALETKIEGIEVEIKLNSVLEIPSDRVPRGMITKRILLTQEKIRLMREKEVIGGRLVNSNKNGKAN